ncbi:hypothetical protein GLYMA_15G046766v4 [Glycine max]|nr:hypothetical protein GLYMA_15G046766v4 [Glycine max]KAH1145591.1 hypothetical protein GYH30_041350 [Glycine max]
MGKEMQQLICAFVLITLSFMMFSAEARNLHAFQQQAMEEPSAAGLQLQSLLFESTIGFGMLPRGAIPPSGPSTPTHSYCCCYYYSWSLNHASNCNYQLQSYLRSVSKFMYFYFKTLVVLELGFPISGKIGSDHEILFCRIGGLFQKMYF